jgi:hypothetical protein
MEDLISKIKGMCIVQTDDFKTELEDIKQEQITNAYNKALEDVLYLLKSENSCEHDWYNIPNYDEKKGDWKLCNKCKVFCRT